MTDQQFERLLEALEGLRVALEQVHEEIERGNVAAIGEDLGDLP